MSDSTTPQLGDLYLEVRAVDSDGTVMFQGYFAAERGEPLQQARRLFSKQAATWDTFGADTARALHMLVDAMYPGCTWSANIVNGKELNL